MYTVDFNKPGHIHFIGIGGISMSGLAKLLLSKGFKVSGSDQKKSEITEELTAQGAIINITQRAANITDDIDAVVYTAAIHEDNEELAAARAKNKHCLTRAELMGQVMLQYKNAIGISGTHGKTTTTSMLSLILLENNMDPTISVGGILPEINGNFRIGGNDFFTVESCEYTNSFLDFHPTDAIILNIDADHLDFFKDINDIRRSFRRFAELVPESGELLINSEIDDHKTLFDGLKCKVKTYGIAENGKYPEDFDYAAANISFDEMSRGSYDFYAKGSLIGHVTLALTGLHNVSNSLPAIALALKYGVPFKKICETLKKFTGTKRRFEFKGSIGDIKIYDDYAHHPSEIRATLTAAQKYERNRLITIFQPHTYTRTKALLPEFADALSLSDVVVLADIYAARETNTVSVSSDDIRLLLEKKGKEVYYFHTFDEIENFLLEFSTSGDLLITMGAGDIVNVGEELLGQ